MENTEVVLYNYSHKKNLIRTLTQLNIVNDANNPLDCLDNLLDAENFLRRTIAEFKRNLKKEEQKEFNKKFGFE